MTLKTRLAHEGRTFDAYMAVRHLTSVEAARRLGKHPRTVAEYRVNNPAAAFDPAARNPSSPARPGAIAYMVPVNEPNKASNGAATRWAAVTLPAPPPGPHCQPFERQGVRG